MLTSLFMDLAVLTTSLTSVLESNKTGIANERQNRLDPQEVGLDHERIFRLLARDAWPVGRTTAESARILAERSDRPSPMWDRFRARALGLRRVFAAVVDGVHQADSAFKDGGFAAALIGDERHFLGALHIITADQHVVVPVRAEPERGTLLKRISTLKRRPDITEEDFRQEWIVHRDLVLKMPGVSGYRQNVVIARERVKGTPCGYDELPIDGIVELWFESPAALEEAFFLACWSNDDGTRADIFG